MKKSIVVFLMLLPGSMLFSQVSVNSTGNPPDSSAMLDVSSTGRGMLVPRMSATDRDLISNPATGLLIFCTDDNQFYLNRGTPAAPQWTAIHSQWENNGTSLYYIAGKVGVGTMTPEFRLSVDNDGGILAKGTYNSGTTLSTTGEGARLIWYPRKAAFRAGYVNNPNWDNDSIGNYTVAMGSNTKATGSSSFALGANTTASGDRSVAMGNLTTASGINSVAMGKYTNAHSFDCLAIGRYNVGGGTADAWVDNDPIFEIGIGTGPSGKNNAVTVLKSGSMGIGTASPDGSALVDISSTMKGFLPPRMTSPEMSAISNPAIGLMIFNLDINKPVFFDGNLWSSFDGQNYCGLPFIDSRDGQSYNTVLIGTQCWMAENLNVGTMIDSLQTMQNDGIIEKYCYRNEEDSCTKYGALYQWDEMMQYTTTPGVQGICPEGFHVPTDDEWTTLTDYASSVPDFCCNSNTTYIAKALAATTLWRTSTLTCTIGNNLAQNNATGFSALPGGRRITNGSFFFILGDVGFWWSSTEDSGSDAWTRYLLSHYEWVFRYDGSKTYGFSLRCLKD